MCIGVVSFQINFEETYLLLFQFHLAGNEENIMCIGNDTRINVRIVISLSLSQ